MNTKGWKIRRSNPDNFSAIAEFRKSFPKTRTVNCEEAEYHKHKCINPASEGFIWLAENNNTVVSTASMTPKIMKILGDEILAAETGDTFTLPEYQGRGIFTELVKNTTAEAIRKKIDFIYGVPNSNSVPGYVRKLNYGVIPSAKLCVLVRPLNIERGLKRRLRISVVAIVLAFIFKTMSRTFLKLSAVGIGKNSISISEARSFPETIEKLWGKVSQNYDVILARTKEYLDWRFGGDDNDDYLIRIARNRDQEVEGYAVAKLIDNDNSRIAYIADFLTSEDSPRVFNKLMLELLNMFDKRRIDVVYTWTIKGSFYYKCLLRLGFMPVANLPIICYKNDLGTRILRGAHKWHFTIGDSDNI